MSRIRAFLYAIWFLISVLVVIVLMAIFRSKNHAIRRVWARLERAIIGYELEINGEFKECDMIVMNHKSMLDIIILEEIYPKNLSWIAKKEIGDLPILGNVIKLPKMISIDRGNARAVAPLIKEVKARLDEGRVIAMFPEGTRARGEKMLKFHSGAKLIAGKLNLRVQPIVLTGTASVMDSKEFRINKGKIGVHILDIVDTSDERWLENLRLKMQEVYDKNL
ncbi:MAG: 1-acyl-sn-glycerol-3-phosphate acyltransferase [Campylobacter sp.]|nr:1-acyl-sn-glycerol-3-phosphate acyltransferase [Campylobacter sp.]